MIRLNLTAEPKWIEVATGVKLLVAPLSTAMMVAARSDESVARLREDASQEVLAIAMAKAIARRVIIEWDGVGDENGNAIEATKDGIDALMEVWPIFEAFQVNYVAKGLVLDAEKNVSALSPNGTSAAALDTALPAKPSAQTVPAI